LKVVRAGLKVCTASPFGLSVSLPCDQSDFPRVRKADPGIVQKDEIAIVHSMRDRITHKRDLEVTLLPDCGAPLHARH
jgi:hypothetical protein